MDKIVVQWRNFGPYHIARLNALWQKLRQSGIEVVGLETVSRERTYPWNEHEGPIHFQRITLFPDRQFQDIKSNLIMDSVTHELNSLNPIAICISGYISPDAIACLRWCRRHKQSAILMSDSHLCSRTHRLPQEWIKSHIVRLYDAALCAGRPHKKYLESMGMKSDQISVGYDVVENDYFWERVQKIRKKRMPPDELPEIKKKWPFFLCVSQFVPKKNIQSLIKAYEIYRKLAKSNGSNPPWQLVIVGEGHLRLQYEQLVRDKRIAGIIFTGFQQIHKLAAYYACATVLVHPAIKEEWGLVVNEAMASGLPVIVSKMCGCAEDLVEDGKNGFLIDPFNIDDLVEKMLQIINLSELKRKAMGQRSQEIIKDWGLERFASGLKAALDKALAAEPRKVTALDRLLLKALILKL